jgi:hypothetical protein
MQERYWRLLVQLKADALYTGCYVERSETTDTGISMFSALVASGSISVWAIWKTLDWLWATFVALSQVLAVVKQYLPFKRRIAPVRAAAYSYEEIFLKAEARWFDVAEGRLSDAEINQLIADLKLEQLKAWKKGVGNLTIPINRWVRKKADRLTADYFSQTYNVTVTIRK